MMKLGKNFTLEEFCTCTNTYRKYSNRIDDPYPQNPASIAAIKDLCLFIIDPIVDYFGKEKFQLTYGFCSRK
jgi:hypothetical protein